MGAAAEGLWDWGCVRALVWVCQPGGAPLSFSEHPRKTVIRVSESQFSPPTPSWFSTPTTTFQQILEHLLSRTSAYRLNPCQTRKSPVPSPQLPIPRLVSVCGYPLLCLDLSTMARKSKSVLSKSESNYRPHRASSPAIKSEPHTNLVADELHPSTTDTLTPPSSPLLRLFRPTILSSDHRNSKLSPSSAALSSVTSRNYISSHRQHVLPLSERHTHPTSVVNQRNGSQTSDKSSQSSSSLKGSPTSSHPVFNNVNDLAAHHGIPTFLPPAPRTANRRISSLDEMPPSSENDPFSSLCSEYLNMLDNPTSEMSLNTASLPQNSADEAAAQAILTILRAGKPDHVLSLTHWESLTDCGCSPGDSSAQPPSEFLTSPMESPFDDFLSTPGLRNEDFPSDFTSPLIADGDDFGASFHDTPLFEDAGLFEPHSSSDKRAAPSLFPAVHLDSMYTLSPVTPALDASPLYAPPPSRLSSNLPTGTRKNLTPEALIPLDAPVQPRNYLTPSVTSRKDPQRKRSRTEALGDDDEADKELGELDAVAAKRLQNTLAARRSRKRKLEHQLELEITLEHEKQQKEQWRSRAMTLEALLLSHGIPVPPAMNY